MSVRALKGGALLCLPLMAIVTAHAPKVAADAPAQAAPAAAPAPSLETLFDAFAKSPGLEAHFREEKKIALLFAPLRSEGVLHFDRTKGLARHTLTPSKQSVLLSGGTLSLWDGTKTEKIELKKTPELRAFADGFSMLLAADRPGLERSFKLEFSADPQGQWRLRLLPFAKEVRAIVSEIEVAGKGIALRTLRVLEASGDESTTTFSDVDTQKRYSEAAAAAVFRVPPTAP